MAMMLSMDKSVSHRLGWMNPYDHWDKPHIAAVLLLFWIQQAHPAVRILKTPLQQCGFFMFVTDSKPECIKGPASMGVYSNGGTQNERVLPRMGGFLLASL